MRTMLLVACCAGVLDSNLVLAQQPQTPQSNVIGPQVVPLTTECLYRGWRATRILGAEVASRSKERLGTARNIIIGAAGSIEALIVEGVALPGFPEFVYRVPRNKIAFEKLPDTVIADIRPGKQEQHGLLPPKDKPAYEFSVTQVIGDYARLRAGLAYGYVSDVVFANDGRMFAILVTRDSAMGGGTYAFGFPGTIWPWNPAAGYYGLPYVTTSQTDAAAIRVEPKRFGKVANQEHCAA